VRIVAATNMNLDEAVHDGRFRSDLYHRLNQFQLHVPPLRERPDDIAALAEFLLDQILPGGQFSPAALEVLLRAPWKGNVRELRNVLLKTAMHIEAGRAEVRPADLLPWLGHQKPSLAQPQAFQGSLDDLERKAILEALAKTGGDRDETSRQLGISRRTLTRKLQQYEKGEAVASVLGRINSDQQRYFRVAVHIPADVQLESGARVAAEISNVSIGGVALSSSEAFKNGAIVQLCFGLNKSTTITTSAEVVWVERKRAGLKFTSLSATARRDLGQWLMKKAQAEGWDISTTATEVATV
jgi:lambda repressor-like predicted transcriptional regulator